MDFWLSTLLISAPEMCMHHRICLYTKNKKITWQWKIQANGDSKLSLVCVFIPLLTRDFLEQRILIFIFFLNKQKLKTFWKQDPRKLPFQKFSSIFQTKLCLSRQQSPELWFVAGIQLASPSQLHRERGAWGSCLKKHRQAVHFYGSFNFRIYY